jgi:hypothetical protein
MLDFAIWGHEYGGHHATNLVLYVAAIWAWFGALVGFGLDRKVAGIAVLLWALHPSHAESVAWLAERKGLLAIALSGATALCFVRFRAGRARSAGWLALAMVLAVAAVWSKAHAAFTLAALAGLELVLPGPSRRRSIGGLAAIGVVAAAAFVPVLKLALAASVVGTETAPAGRLAMVLGVHGFYVQLGALVQSTSVSYPLSHAGPTTLDVILGAAALVAVVTGFALPRAPRPVRAGCALWLFGWLPVSHLLIPLQMVFVADRYLLVPSLGLALVVAGAIDRIARPRLAYGLLAVIAVGSLFRALDARSTWADRETLWARAVEHNPADGSAWSSYAEAVAARDPARAFELVDEGLRHSQHPRLLLRRALLLAAHGDRDAARTAMRAAADAGEPRAMSNLALMLLPDHDRLDEALAFARRGAAASPVYEPGHRAHGSVALAAKRYPEARAAFVRAFELVPSCVNAYNLAVTELELGELARAHAHLTPCERDPVLAPRVAAALAELARRR